MLENQIKLVVSDVDSTLLMPGEEHLEERFFKMAQSLKNKGIALAIASGRTYEELKSIFNKAFDDIYFIPLDGGMVIYRDEVLYFRKIPKKYTEFTLNAMKKSNILFYAKDFTYFKWQNDDYKDSIIHTHHKNIKRIESIDDIKEDIYKITFYKENSYEFERYKSYVKNNNMLVSQYDDGIWCDFHLVGTNKGTATEFLTERLGIKNENVAAFGDNTNDVDMLKKVKYSFVMKHSSPQIKGVARNITEDVIAEIERMVKNGTVCY